MAQVSRYPLTKDVYQRVFEILFQSIANIRNPQEVKEFFDDFLSPTERIVFAKRLSIAVLLAKGYDYMSIRDVLRVSPPTIASVNLAIKYSGKGYQRVVGKILRADKLDEFLEKVDDFLFDHPPAKRDWREWRKRREAEKRRRQKPF